MFFKLLLFGEEEGDRLRWRRWFSTRGFLISLLNVQSISLRNIVARPSLRKRDSFLHAVTEEIVSIPKIGLQKNENKSGILKSSRSLIDKAALSHPARHNLRLCYARLIAGGFID